MARNQNLCLLYKTVALPLSFVQMSEFAIMDYNGLALPTEHYERGGDTFLFLLITAPEIYFSTTKSVLII